MNFVLVGAGPEEEAWARTLVAAGQHRLVSAFPAWKWLPNLPGGRDLDEALAVAGVEAAVIGGLMDLRAEALRRVAAAGWPAIVLHPPGPNADPYYQVALSRQETGAIVVPELPGRLQPGWQLLQDALASPEMGALRELRYEVPTSEDADLAGEVFARVVDVVRGLLGEIEAVTATGDPVGERPTSRLVVQLRASGARRGEIRLLAGVEEVARLSLVGSAGAWILEHDPSFLGPARLLKRHGPHETSAEFPPWDPRDALLHVLGAAVAGREVHPDLLDGTRAMELTEAVARSLRRGRTIDLEYEQLSEAGNFKSVMTGLGCGLLLLALIIVPVALAGPVLGYPWTIYLAWLIPPILVLFLTLQLLRFAIR
jgi:myo-inositol 2-dehydrogenase/D-chiro-inositol 1-dehydrogenase